MKHEFDESRRRLLKRVSLGVALAPIAGTALRSAWAASKASGAKPGSKCENCKLFQGAAGAAQGPCLLFPGKAVKATGWCSSWTAKT